MPLLAAQPAATADLEAMVAAGWRVEAVEDDDGVTVTVSRPVAFTAATAAEAQAAARAYADARR